MRLTRQGLVFKDLNESNKIQLREKFTLKEQKGFGKHVSYIDHCYYQDKGQYFIIPKFGLKNAFKMNIISVIKTCPLDVYLEGVKFTQNQSVIINYIGDLFKKYLKEDKIPLRTGRTIIMDTGQGKTYVAMGLIEKFKQKTLYVVHNEDSLLRTYKKFTECIRSKNEITIGRIYGKIKQDGDIVIIIINSLLNLDEKYFSNFGLVIYDEIHKYITRTRIKMFMKTNTIYNIGLTATPINANKKGFESIMKAFVGPLLYANDLPGYVKDEIKFNGSVRLISYEGITEPQKGAFYISAIKTINKFHEDEIRSSIIINEIECVLEKSNNVYVFAETTSYLEHIYFKCRKLRVKMTMLKGGATNEDFEDAYVSRIIFTTYAFGTEGLSIAHMDAILYATPRKSGTRQSSGRIVRLDGDSTKLRCVIDIVDTNLSLKNQLPIRKKVYKERGFPIKEIDYNIFREFWTPKSNKLYCKKTKRIVKIIRSYFKDVIAFIIIKKLF